MKKIVLIVSICLVAAPAFATSPTYAKKAAAATAAAAAASNVNRSQQTPASATTTGQPAANALGAQQPDALEKPTIDSIPKQTVFSDQDKADITRIETYLNDLKSISADFLQIDDQGDMMRGSIAIQRPGKMRVTYAPPSKDFIVADGDWVHIWDASLKSQTNVPEDSSLANFILRKNISLHEGITVTKFQRFPNKLELTLVQTDDAGLGSLTLIFEDKPLMLRQWRVNDAQGHTTGVNLENERSGVDFPHDTFTFVPPNFGKNTGSQIPN